MLRIIEFPLSVKSLQSPLICAWPSSLPPAPFARVAIAVLLANIGSPLEISDPAKTRSEKPQC
jgi:hypothetical protein